MDALQDAGRYFNPPIPSAKGLWAKSVAPKNGKISPDSRMHRGSKHTLQNILLNEHRDGKLLTSSAWAAILSQ